MRVEAVPQYLVLHSSRLHHCGVDACLSILLISICVRFLKPSKPVPRKHTVAKYVTPALIFVTSADLALMPRAVYARNINRSLHGGRATFHSACR